MPEDQDQINEQPGAAAPPVAQAALAAPDQSAPAEAAPASPAPVADPVAPVPPADDPAPAASTKKPRRVRRQEKVVQRDLATGQDSVVAAVTDEELAEAPTKVTLAAPYGFYEDDGALRSWAQGQQVEDPDEIALLIERGAIFTSE